MLHKALHELNRKEVSSEKCESSDQAPSSVSLMARQAKDRTERQMQRSSMHRLYRHQSKMLSSKKLTCKGALWQVFIRVCRLEIQSVMLIFSTQLCELLLLSPSLWFWCSVPQADKSCRKVPIQVKFL
jgi:hypothetical protein